MIGKGGGEAWVLFCLLSLCTPVALAGELIRRQVELRPPYLGSLMPKDLMSFFSVVWDVPRARPKKTQKNKTVFTFGKPLLPPIEESL